MPAITTALNPVTKTYSMAYTLRGVTHPELLPGEVPLSIVDTDVGVLDEVVAGASIAPEDGTRLKVRFFEAALRARVFDPVLLNGDRRGWRVILLKEEKKKSG